jgi:hypothetical protein
MGVNDKRERKFLLGRDALLQCERAVLATCDIHAPNRALKNVFQCIPSLRLSQSERRIESIRLLIFIKGNLIL